MNFDCKSMLPKCKAECCGVVPIPKEIWENNKHKAPREFYDLIQNEEVVVPLTADAYCPFLSLDFQCSIYDDRPEVCRKFGDESHPMLCCPHLTKCGNERTRSDRRRVIRQTNDHLYKLKIVV